MQALIAFVTLATVAAVCFVAGAYLLAGAGVALLTAGACSLSAAAFISRGIGHG